VFESGDNSIFVAFVPSEGVAASIENSIQITTKRLYQLIGYKAYNVFDYAIIRPFDYLAHVL